MNEMIYLYDGSFHGFLCCIFESYAKKESPTAIACDEALSFTLFPTRNIATDSGHALRVLRKVRTISSLRRRAFCSGAFSPALRKRSFASTA